MAIHYFNEPFLPKEENRSGISIDVLSLIPPLSALIYPKDLISLEFGYKAKQIASGPRTKDCIGCKRC